MLHKVSLKMPEKHQEFGLNLLLDPCFLSLLVCFIGSHFIVSFKFRMKQ